MRWETAEGRRLATEASRWLHGKSPRRPKGLAVVDGRVDLRGFAMHHLESAATTAKRGTVLDARWKSLDFRGSRLGHMRWFSVEVSDCLFDDATLDDLRVWESEISGSSFVGASLEGSPLGTGQKFKRNGWTRVDFTSANLRDVHFDAADLEEVNFSYARLDNVQFRHCRLVDIRFAGELREVVFESRPFRSDGAVGFPMKSVDFGDAEFRDVEFRGCHFESVTFPRTQHHLIIPNFPAVALQVLEAIAPDPSDSARTLTAVLENRLKLPGEHDSDGIFTREDLVRRRNEEYAEYIFDRFREAQEVLTSPGH